MRVLGQLLLAALATAAIDSVAGEAGAPADSARGAADRAAAGAPDLAPVPSNTDPHRVGAAPPESVWAIVRHVAAVAESLRGLEFTAEVPVAIVSDSTARRHFLGRLSKHYPRERLDHEARAFVQLGLLPPGTDLMSTLLDVLEEQAGGYYDPERATFFLLDDMPRSVLPVLAVHELTHALDDQHHDIDSTLARLELQDEDRAAAFGAVLEGSGTLVMTCFVMREMQAGRLTLPDLMALQASEVGRAEKLRGAPAVLRRSLLAPYVLGQTFLLRGKPGAVHRGLVAADVESAFLQPPLSMEQVLHPEKYWEASHFDAPRPVPAPDLSAQLGSGWRKVDEGTLGELLLGALVGAEEPAFDDAAMVDPRRWTNKAAAGWGGDRWTLYRRGDESCTVLATVWDSRRDALEFAAALRLPRGCRVRRRDRAVVVVAGVRRDRADRVAEPYLDALARQR